MVVQILFLRLKVKLDPQIQVSFVPLKRKRKNKASDVSKKKRR